MTIFILVFNGKRMNQPLPSPDQATLERLKNGDMHAFDLVYRAYCRKLHSFVFKIIKVESEAEEIVQEVFLKIWDSRGQMDSTARLDAWLFTIAYNTTVSLIRKKLTEKKYMAHLKSLQTEYILQETTDEITFDGLTEQLNKLIDRLPARQKEVFRLHREQGLTYLQIAGKLNIAVNTVENHMVRAFRFLRQNLAQGRLTAFLFCTFYL